MNLYTGSKYRNKSFTFSAKKKLTAVFCAAITIGIFALLAALTSGLINTPPVISSFLINNNSQYANTASRLITASGIFSDADAVGALKIQFSQDGVNWGAYSGSGSTNNKDTGWTYYKTVPAGALSQDIVNAWYLEGTDGSKTIFVRAQDDVGNVGSGSTTFTDSFTTSAPAWLNDETATTAFWDSNTSKIQLPFGSSSSVYVSEYFGNRIQRFDMNSTFLAKWGSAGSADGQFSNPWGLATDSSGNVYVSDINNNRIQKFNSTGNFIAKWGSLGSADGQFNRPYGVEADIFDNIYVADTNNNRIQKFDSNGNFLTKWGAFGLGDGQFSSPVDVAIDSLGNVYVVDNGNARIQKFNSNGLFITKWGQLGSGDSQFSNPFGVAVDSSDIVYVSDFDNNRVQKFDSSGNFISKWGTLGSGDGQLSWPAHIDIDLSGNIYVAEFLNNRIQKFDSAGNFISKWGTAGSGDGQFNRPVGIAIANAAIAYLSNKNIVQSKTIDTTVSDIDAAILTATENNDAGTSVNYQLSRDGGLTWENVANGASYTFTSASTEKSDLRWRATLIGSASASPIIEDISVTYTYLINDSISLDTVSPTDPSGLITSAVSSSQINLSWVASTDTASSVTYKIERANDVSGTPGGFTQIATSSTNSYSDSSVSANTKYWYRVKAFDEAGNESGYSLNSSTTTLSDAPTTPFATDGTLVDQIAVSWSPSLNADHYHVYRDGAAGAGTLVHNSSATSFTDPIADDSLHTYYIYSANSADQNSSTYITDTGFRKPFPPAAPAIGIPQVLSSTSIQWYFTDNSSVETGFKLHDSAHNELGSASAYSSDIIENGLLPNTSYTRHVHAYNISGESTASSDATATTLSDAPTLPIATDGTYADKINVSWTASPSANHYHVYRDGQSGVGTLIFNAAGTSVDDMVTGSHFYYIYAVNTADTENPSGIQDIGFAGPTLTIKAASQGAGKDARVAFLEPSRNYGNDITMHTEWYSSWQALALVEFDLSSIPTGATINDAKLVLYHFSSSSPVHSAQVQSIDQPWNEGTVTWNTKPAYGSYTEDSTGEIYNEDVNLRYWQVTNLVGQWISGVRLNNGMILRSSGESYSYWTSDYSDSARYPRLIVNYTGPPLPPSAAPTAGTPETLSSSSIRWNFTDNSNNEDGFKLHDAAHNTLAIAPANSGSFTETSLLPNTTYTRHIHAYNAAGESDATLDVTKTTLADTPTKPIATDGTLINQIQVSWAASMNADHYHAYKDSTSTTGTLVHHSNTVSFTDPILDDNFHRYYIYAANKDDVLNSNYIIDDGYRALQLVLLPPMVTANDDNRLNVAVGDDGNGPNILYAIYNSTLNKYLQIDGSLGSTPVYVPDYYWGGLSGVENINLSPDTPYQYQLRAMNSDNQVSLPGPESAVVRTFASKPYGASAIGVDDGAGSQNVKVSWNSGEAQTKFRVYSSSDNYTTIKYEGTATQFTEIGLNPANTYGYRIFAVNGDNVENPDYVTATSQLSVLPLMAPTMVALMADSESQISATFLDNSTTEDDFHFYFDISPGALLDDSKPKSTISKATVGTSDTKTISDLAPNTRYFVRTRAHDHALNSFSSYSEDVAIYTKALTPLAPDVSKLEDGNYKIIVNSDGNPSYTKYAIYNNEAGSYVQPNGSTAPTAVFLTIAQWGNDGAINSGLSPSISYTYKIKAINGDGNETGFGPVSPPVSEPPIKPYMLQPSDIASSSITWNWRDNSYNEQGFVLHDSQHNEIARVGADTTFYTENNLAPDTLYSRHIHSFDSAGQSQPSNIVNTKTLLAGPTQLNVEVEPSPSTTVNIAWQAPVTWMPASYKIYRFSSKITLDNLDQALTVANPTQTSYTDNGNSGEVYYYQVTAVHQDGRESDLSTNIISDVARIGARSPHGKYNLNTAACVNCHRGHTGVAKALIAKNNEQICFTCHDGTGSVYNIAATYPAMTAHDVKLSLPQTSDVKCTYCHDPHGTNNPWALKNNQPDTCFTCHNANLNTLNLWNIQAQFNMTSRHNMGDNLKCTNCHGPHTAQAAAGNILSDPDNTNNLWAGSKTDFCLKCHDGLPPKKSWLTNYFVPEDVIFPSMALNKFFPGWDKSAYKSSGHNIQGIQCDKCHHPHGSNNQRLTAYDLDSAPESNTKEEGLCLKCHGQAGPESWKNFNALLAQSSRHPITDKSDLHTDTENEDNLGALKRHAECVDCHNPHENSPTPAKTATSAPNAYGAIKGVAGVGIINGAPDTPSIFAPKIVDKEYELCFKCHSSFVQLPPDTTKPDPWIAEDPFRLCSCHNTGAVRITVPPSYPTGTWPDTQKQDKSSEFNPSNPSFHPVEKAGKNLGIKDETFVEGTAWNPLPGDDPNYNAASPKIYCTDCHGNDTPGLPSGPHGSGTAPILSSSNICLKCHKQTVYESGQADLLGSRYSHKMAATPGTCLYCHTAHGSSNNKHLMLVKYEHIEPGEQGMVNGGGAILNCGANQAMSCHVNRVLTQGWIYPSRYEAAYK